MTAERKSDFKLTTYTQYLALTGELLDVCGDEYGENWLRYNGKEYGTIITRQTFSKIFTTDTL